MDSTWMRAMSSGYSTIGKRAVEITATGVKSVLFESTCSVIFLIPRPIVL